MDVPSSPTLAGQRMRLHGDRTEEEADKISWFAMEAATPSGTHRAQGDCPFPVRFTKIHLPHSTIVSGPTGQLTVSGGQYRIVYPDSLKSDTSWIVIFRDESMTSQDNTSHPGTSSHDTGTQPAQDTFWPYTGNYPYGTSSDNSIFNHEVMVDQASPAQDSQVTYRMEYGNEGFFDEAMSAITTSLTDDITPETSADMVEAMCVDSTPEQQVPLQGRHSIDSHHTELDASGFQNHEYTCQKFQNIFSAAIVPETDPEQLRQEALDNEQLQNCYEYHAVNPTWPKPPSLALSRPHPKTLHSQDSAGTKVMGPFDNIQKQGFLTIRLPTVYRVYSAAGTVTSFDVPFYDGREQAGGGVYSFHLPTSLPANYELPCLHPSIIAAFDLSRDHRICRDGKFIPNTLIEGPHEVKYVNGDIEIVNCRDSSCLLKNARDQGEAPASDDTHDSGAGSGAHTDLENESDQTSQDSDNQSAEDAGGNSPEDKHEQTPNDGSDESEEVTDGEWDYLPKHMRPPQHRRTVMAEARELLRPCRDWLYNEAKKGKEAEEEEKKNRSEETEEERKRREKEELKRESELYRQAAYKENTRRKRERDRLAQQKREVDARELAAMMQQQEAAGGTMTRRPQRRTARAAVDYREKVAVHSSSSEADSDEDESSSKDGSEDEEA